jgi:phosphatidate phosphatase APP1
MSLFYRCLLAKPVRPPLFVVSGSPIQFAPRLVDFLSTHDFPFAGLHLRRLSPSTMKDYKQPLIRKILARFQRPAILIGDSGEHDPEVYAEIRKESPVLRTYIRDAGNSSDNARFSDALLFKDALDAIRDAKDHGFIAPSCL